MKSIFRQLAALVVIGGALGCGRNRADTVIDPDAATTLIVDNQAFPDMTIYVLDGSRRVRLGMATGHSKTQFTLPKYLIRTITPVRFLADPIGSTRTPVSDEITVTPGDSVTLRIPPS